MLLLDTSAAVLLIVGDHEHHEHHEHHGHHGAVVLAVGKLT